MMAFTPSLISTQTANRVIRSLLHKTNPKSHHNNLRYCLPATIIYHRHHSTTATPTIPPEEQQQQQHQHDSSNISSSTPYISGTTTHFGYQSVPTAEKQNRVKQVFENVAENYDIMNDLMSAGIHRYWKDELCRMTYVETISKSLQMQQQQQQQREGNKTTTTPSFSILDVAGGTGDVAFRFINAANITARTKNPPLSVTVADINPHMLSVGERRARDLYGDAIVAVDNENDNNNTDDDDDDDDDSSLSPRTTTVAPLSFVEANAEHLPFDDDSFDLYTIAFGLRNVTDVDKALRDAHRVLKPGGRFLCLEFSTVDDCELLRRVYDSYSFNVIPAMGKWVADDEESYRYLVESIRKFSGKEELKRRVEEAGFEGSKYTEMTMGVVAVHEGWKPL